MATDNPTCPTCGGPLTYVKGVPFEARWSDRRGLVTAMESNIFRCQEHLAHGLWLVFMSGDIVPYQDPDA